MTAVCANGHATSTIDYCDVCGVKLGGEAQPTEVLSAPTSVVAAPRAEPELCPSCGAARLHGDLFCERCGHAFNGSAGPSENASGWRAVVAADRGQFDSVVADGLDFPDGLVSGVFDLGADEVPIGRGAPGGIDLGPGRDHGVSRAHAALLRLPDGSYCVVDRGSTNGTRINDDPAPIAEGARVPLRDGDRIRIGAWTTITINLVPGT